MREIISGRDVGNTVDFRNCPDGQRSYGAKHPWPADTTVSAGKGLVLRRNPKDGEPSSYTTLFMEVYPPGAAFIRGEGDSPEACENAAWAKYQLALNCADGGAAHDWESRGYRNGAGFCSRCDTFGSKVFTGEQLGQHCKTCGVGTTYHWHKNEAGTEEFLCEDHYETDRPEWWTPSRQSFSELLESLLDDAGGA